MDIARRNEVVVYAVEKPGGFWRPGYRLDFHSGPQTGVPNVLRHALRERFLPALALETGGQYRDPRAACATHSSGSSRSRERAIC